MTIILEIKAGSLVGKKVEVTQSLVVGRASDRAQFVVPHDNYMSGVHFTVECRPSECRVIDKKSANGTFLNGKKIQEAMLATGDEIKAGQTVFIVRVVPDDELDKPDQSTRAAKSIPPSPALLQPPLETQKIGEKIIDPQQPSTHPKPKPAPVKPSRPPCALTIGGWSFSDIPSGWQVEEDVGIRLDTKDSFPSRVIATEEPLGQGITLPQYVELQTKMFREYLREPKIYAAVSPRISGASETMSLEVRYTTKDGHSIYLQRVYARSGSVIGLLTLTTLEKDLPSVRSTYDLVLSGVSFSKSGDTIQ